MTPIFLSTGKVQVWSILLKILSSDGTRKKRPCLIISLRIESVPDDFLVLSLDM